MARKTVRTSPREPRKTERRGSANHKNISLETGFYLPSGSLLNGGKHITRHQHFVSSLLIYMIIFPIFLYTFCERYLK